MKITLKTNEDVSYRGEPIRKMERTLDRAMKKAGFSFVRTTKMGDHQFKKDGKTYSYHIHGQSGDQQYFDYVTVTKGEVGWDKDIERKSFDDIDGAVAWLSTKTSEKRIAKKYGAKNEGPGAGYCIKLKNVNVDKVWVDSARQYSILKAKFSADWEANHSYWDGEGSADDFEVAIYLDRSLDEFMEWPGAEEEYAQKGSLFDFVKDTCLDDIKNMLNFDCGREGYTYGGGWITKIPSDGVFEFDNMQFDPDACTVYQYHDKSYVPVSITSEDMMYGIQDAWDEWNNPENPEDESKKSEDASIVDDLLARHNQKWLVKVSYDVDASHSAVAPSIVRADTKDAATNIALKRHRGLGYNMKVVSVEPMTESCKKSEGLPPKKLGNRLYRSRADLINKMKTLDAVEITTPAQFNDIHSKQWLHTAGYAMDINGNLVGQTYFGDKDGKWYYATTKTFQGDYLPECKEDAKKSESLTLKQAELKKMAKYGEAEDITSISDAEAKELKKSGVELVGISRGIYGMNGALMRGTTDGKLYVITSRNSNLFYFV